MGFVIIFWMVMVLSSFGTTIISQGSVEAFYFTSALGSFMAILLSFREVVKAIDRQTAMLQDEEEPEAVPTP